MSNDKHTRKIAVIGNGLVSVETERSETISSLRAEKAELIEALKLASTRFAYLALYDNTERNGVIPTVGMNDIDRTLAKYETK